MRVFCLWILACAGLCAAGTCIAERPEHLQIVIGEDEPEARDVSACKRDFGADPLGGWITRTAHSLCATGHAESLLAVFLFTAPGIGAHAGPDFATLDRAYAMGKSNPLVLWTVVLTSKCRMPFQASECSRMLKAARLLAQADAGNAMAFLALGYAADASLADPREIAAALEHANAARRVHDYGFDLMKLAVEVSGRVPIPDAVRGQQSAEQFRLQFANPVAATGTVVGWLRAGCNATNAIPPPAPEACARARRILEHGDSLETLSGDAIATAEMSADRAVPHGNDHAAYASAFVDSISESSSEREWLGNLKRRLQSQ